MEEKRQQQSISRAREASAASVKILELELEKKKIALNDYEQGKLDRLNKGEKVGTIPSKVKAVIDEEKKLTEARELNINLLKRSEAVQEGIINKSKYLADEQDRIAKAARIKNTGSDKIPTKD